MHILYIYSFTKGSYYYASGTERLSVPCSLSSHVLPLGTKDLRDLAGARTGGRSVGIGV